MLPKEKAESKVEIWFQDEARIGQQGSLTRIWAPTGTRPRVVKQQQFISSYIFGAICPEKNKAAAIASPVANTFSLQFHLDEISHHVTEESMLCLLWIKQGGINQVNSISQIIFPSCFCHHTLLSLILKSRSGIF